eukprot:6342550-Pyramimonas_sp.AAC.1
MGLFQAWPHWQKWVAHSLQLASEVSSRTAEHCQRKLNRGFSIAAEMSAIREARTTHTVKREVALPN